MNKHLMLDFETLGTSPDTVVLSLGAVIFNAGEIIAEKEWPFQVHDQLKAKSAVNFDTVAWWLEQNAKAREVFNKCKLEGISISAFVMNFEEFVKPYGPDIRVWGNGATFDVSIIESILSRAGRPIPWKFFNVRCYRTMKACFGIELVTPRTGTKHCAIEDAKYQTQALQVFLRTNPAADQ